MDIRLADRPSSPLAGSIIVIEDGRMIAQVPYSIGLPGSLASQAFFLALDEALLVSGLTR